jgi:hypothetical protein
VVLGQAAGDALGVGYEGREAGRWRWKMIGGRSGFEPGEWTGDTQQAVIVGVARSEPLALASGLLDWYTGGPKDIEMGTAALLSHAAGEPGRVTYAAREQAEVSKAAGAGGLGPRHDQRVSRAHLGRCACRSSATTRRSCRRRATSPT